MNKKGAFTDLFVFIVIAFILMVCLGIFTYVAGTSFTAVRDKISENEDAFPNQNATQVVENTLGDVPASYTVLYWGSVVILVGMIISIFIGSYLVTTRPLFFVPYFILTLVAVIVSAPISNVYEDLINDPTLASAFSNYVGANFILLFLPYIVAVVGIVGGIIMFGSYKASQNEASIFIG